MRDGGPRSGPRKFGTKTTICSAEKALCHNNVFSFRTRYVCWVLNVTGQCKMQTADRGLNFFSHPFTSRLLPAPTNCPWVSEDESD